MSVCGSSLSEITCIFFLRNISVLKNLTIYEKAVVWNAERYSQHFLATGGYVPEVVLCNTSLRIKGIRVYSDMFGCVITEAADTHTDQFVHKLHIVFLEERVFGIYVRKTAYALMGALCAVVIVLNALKSY